MGKLFSVAGSRKTFLGRGYLSRGKRSEGESSADTEGRTFPVGGAAARRGQVLGVHGNSRAAYAAAAGGRGELRKVAGI